MIARRFLWVAAVALALGHLPACSKKDSGGEAEAVKPTHSYQVRGVVKGVRIDRDKTTLSIQHEAIADWVNRQGQTIGMMSMTMEFVAAPRLDVGAVKAGHKIKFTAAVYYGDATRLEISALEALPDDTQLDIAGEH